MPFYVIPHNRFGREISDMSGAREISEDEAKKIIESTLIFNGFTSEDGSVDSHRFSYDLRCIRGGRPGFVLSPTKNTLEFKAVTPEEIRADTKRMADLKFAESRKRWDRAKAAYSKAEKSWFAAEDEYLQCITKLGDINDNNR